jgi:deazaflavin-dependent oxidoreductase (nitroreductase family)
MRLAAQTHRAPTGRALLVRSLIDGRLAATALATTAFLLGLLGPAAAARAAHPRPRWTRRRAAEAARPLRSYGRASPSISASTTPFRSPVAAVRLLSDRGRAARPPLDSALQRKETDVNSPTPSDRPAPDENPAGNAGHDTSRQVRQYRRGRGHRVENVVMSALVRIGVVPHSYLLTTQGRRTGTLRTNPVTVVEHAGRRWLVAPYGVVPWVHNARAAGRVSLTRRFRTSHYTIREVPAQEAGPVLKRYITIASATRAYFRADKNSSVEAFVAEADRHPVFELTPLDTPGSRQ